MAYGEIRFTADKRKPFPNTDVESLMPLTKTTCLGILQLADFWCDDFMKNEALEFVKNHMDSDLAMNIFDNFGVHAILKDIVRKFIIANEQKCDCCEISKIYEFVTPTGSKCSKNKSICSTLGNRMVLVKQNKYDAALNKWETVFTRQIPITADEFKLDFKLHFPGTKFDSKLSEGIYVGVIESEAFDVFGMDDDSESETDDDSDGYQSLGFLLKKRSSVGEFFIFTQKHVKGVGQKSTFEKKISSLVHRL